jgi:hypothetical protein
MLVMLIPKKEKEKKSIFIGFEPTIDLNPCTLPESRNNPKNIYNKHP